MDNRVLSAILRINFASFISKVFYTLNPGAEFSANWHINLIADYLEQVYLGNIKRLIINIPPRMLKSICVSVAWPVWLLGHQSAYRIINTSYSNVLSVKHSLDCRLIINSQWYKNLFTNTVIATNTQHKFSTTRNGFRFATSVGGSVTGEGADILIIDDPHNPTHINSAKMRQKAIDWYEQTLCTRLNNPDKGAIVIVMQRLHENDLSGYLLNKNPDKWHVLKIPIFANYDNVFDIAGKKYFFFHDTLLDEKRISFDYLNNLKKELGVNNFFAQYLQTPIAHETKILALSDIVFCEILPENFDWYCQSWDTAIKVGQQNDFSVCTTWGIKDDKYYLIDVFRKKLIYPKLKMKMQELSNKFKPRIIIIEDKASGQSLIQDLKEEGEVNIVAFKPKLDKETRFVTIVDRFQNGKVILFKYMNSIELVILELTNFPKSDNDDIVDSVSQFLHYIQRVSNKEVRIRNF